MLKKNSYQHKITFIIPTKDRPEQIRNLLLSIQKQKYQPHQIVIVDASKVPIKNIVTAFERLSIDYIRIYSPSLTRQRNIGLKKVLPEITLVGFLDDDIEMEDMAVEKMLKFWEYAPPDLGGAIFNIITDSEPKLWWLKRLFLTGHKKMGVVLKSGYNTKICPAKVVMYTQWLLGGATVWRRAVVEEFKFDERFDGYGLCEDLDYSYNAGKKYKLAVVAEAHVRHINLPIGEKNNLLFGKMEIINRFYFVKKNPELSKMLFFWASFGQFLENVIRIILGEKQTYLLRALGNIQGLVKIVKDGYRA